MWLSDENIAGLEGIRQEQDLPDLNAVIDYLRDRHRRNVEGGRKGGFALKHFTPESKRRQVEGSIKGGSAPKHYSEEGKRRQRAGGARGGHNSHRMAV